jgi:hypothetical protein
LRFVAEIAGRGLALCQLAADSVLDSVHHSFDPSGTSFSLFIQIASRVVSAFPDPLPQVFPGTRSKEECCGGTYANTHQQYSKSVIFFHFQISFSLRI